MTLQGKSEGQSVKASRGGFTLRDFVRESNRIEGIHRDPYPHEVSAHTRFLRGPLHVDALVTLVRSLTKGPTADGQLGKYWMTGAPIRKSEGMDVRVGRHIPPPGGPDIVATLDSLLSIVQSRAWSPYEAHVRYEQLHPFMDGNGRSGRALWLKMMGGIEHAPLGFLHHFYYQTLDRMCVEFPPRASSDSPSSTTPDE